MSEINILPGTVHRISICGKGEIDDFTHASVTHLLSIEDPGTPKETPSWFHGPHLQLQFFDIESNDEARDMNQVMVTRAEVSSILEFARGALTPGSGGVHLLIHCHAGISRSTAAGYAIATQALGPGSETQALEFILRIRPEAFPNLRVAQLADEILARHGQMLFPLAPLRRRYEQMLKEWAARLNFD